MTSFGRTSARLHEVARCPFQGGDEAEGGISPFLELLYRKMKEALRQLRTATATIGTAALLALYVGSAVRLEGNQRDGGTFSFGRTAAGRRLGRLGMPSGAAGPLVDRGQASHYGAEFEGRPTASGEIYDAGLRTAAHPSLPLGSRVRVTNLANGRSTVVRINDRGPFARGRVIDLSRAAASDLDMLGPGSAPVELREER
jgi:peptidoglycan lytic transglycosylase